LKRWRYVGIFSEQLMACAAVVHVGPARQSFWAIHLPEEGRLLERTRMLPSPWASVRFSDGHLTVRDRGVQMQIDLAEQPGIQARCRHGSGEVWTRKQAGVRASGTLHLDGSKPLEIEALAVIDDTAGHHARVTEWRWAAGVGTHPDGRPLAFNLVAGVNDPPCGSERAVWIDGIPQEVPAVSFAEDLSEITCSDGSSLRFEARAARQRHENLLIVKSSYTAPFGSFSGTLPGGVELASGLGVMEHHRAHW
jgi:hypothetical protein